MRIGSTVLLFNKSCVQSYGWNNFRPLGELQGIINSLEEYQCDEISIIRPARSEDNITQFIKDISVIKTMETMTPVCFGGGIRSTEHLKLLSDLPIERLAFSSAFINKDSSLLEMASSLFGHQAIVCVLPVANRDSKTYVFNSESAGYISIDELDWSYIDCLANEVVVIDIDNEGGKNIFDWSLLDFIPLSKNKLIISGGIGEKCVRKAREAQIASVLIDNKVLHQEYSISGFKNA